MSKTNSGLTAATTPLTGTEVVYLVQGGNSRKGTTASFYIPGGTDVAVLDGGTGASTASGARTNLGLVIGTDVQAYSANLTSWAALTRAAGADTFFTTPSSANLRALLTDEVGTGAAYFVGGALGTPASGVATNLTGLPLTTGVTGTLPIGNGGTGQVTASAAFDALSPTTTRGDLIFRNATTNARLAASTSGYHLQTNGAGTDPTYAGFLQTGTGAVTRTWQNKARDFVSAKDFGAVGDGVVDDTTAIQAAVTASRFVYLPAGTYLISGTITLPANTMLVGSGPYASVLTRGGTNQSYLVLGAQCLVEKIGMLPVGAALNVAPTTVPSSGIAIDINNASSCTIRDVWTEYVFNGIRITSVAGCFMDGLNIHNTYSNALACQATTNDVAVNNFVFHANNTTVDALIKLSDGVEALMMSNGDVLSGLYSLFTSATSYTARLHPAFCKFVNVYFDSSANGVNVDKADGFTFSGCWFSNSAANGVNVTQADDTRFIGCDIVHNLGHGAVLASAANTKRTIFSGCNISANNVSNAGADGIAVAAGVSNFVISGCIMTNNYGTVATGNQRYGINIVAGASDNYLIINNNLLGNVTAGLLDGGSGIVKQIFGNLPRLANANGQFFGTTTNDSASAGNVGEYLSSIIASGSAAALTTGVAANMTSLALTPGDWDVDIMFDFTGAATTTVQWVVGSLSLVSATHDLTNGRHDASYEAGAAIYNLVAGNIVTKQVNRRRISIAANTTVYAVASSSFAVSTSTVFGTLTARRVR
jgi:hypothetical protein